MKKWRLIVGWDLSQNFEIQINESLGLPNWGNIAPHQLTKGTYFVNPLDYATGTDLNDVAKLYINGCEDWTDYVLVERLFYGLNDKYLPKHKIVTEVTRGLIAFYNNRDVERLAKFVRKWAREDLEYKSEILEYREWLINTFNDQIEEGTDWNLELIEELKTETDLKVLEFYGVEYFDVSYKEFLKW